MRRGKGKGEMGMALSSALAALVLLAACRAGPPITVRIVEPAEETSVAEPRVRVVLEATGIEIAPAAEQRPGIAHHHLFLDTDVTAPGDTIPAGTTGIIHLGRGQSEFTFDSLLPGEHRVIAVLADAWHVPHGSWRTDTVRFTVAGR
ncbi:MAG: DUF4399 domain-containing protein [Gemmatimonadales bacterium]